MSRSVAVTVSDCGCAAARPISMHWLLENIKSMYKIGERVLKDM